MIQKPRRYTDYSFFSLFTKYQILNSELILYRYGKVIIFFLFRYHNNLTQKAATNL